MDIRINLAPVEVQQAIEEYITKHNPSFAGLISDIDIIDDRAEATISNETTEVDAVDTNADAKPSPKARKPRATKAEMAKRRAEEEKEKAAKADQKELPLEEETAPETGTDPDDIADPDPEEDALLDKASEPAGDPSSLFGES